MTARTLFLVFVFTGCPRPSTDGAVDTDDTDDTDEPIDTDDTDDTDEPVPVVDCTVPVAAPFGRTLLEAPRGYHGLAFDQDGGMVGTDNSSLIRATSSTEAELFVPNFGSAQQMAYLDTGELIVVGGNVQKVSPAGSVEVLASGVGAYGVTIGPDGMIYTANEFRVDRIDPVTGASTVFVPNNQINVPKVLNFNRDGSILYVGTNSSNGAVYQVDIGADGSPEFPVTLLANTGGSWHDGLGIDACGDMYINEFWTSTLYRVTPEGAVDSLIDFDNWGGQAYGHGIEWGLGIGEWSDHNIYVPLPYGGNRVGEIELGRPSKDFNGGNYTLIE